MKVSLFIPCFVESSQPAAGLAVARVLERIGVEVDVPSGQTCCGQPAFNSGYWDDARDAATHFLEVFEGCDCVVCPSGSCTAMVRKQYPELFAGTPGLDRARRMAAKVFEFSEFLVEVLRVTDVGASFPHRVAWHDGCHALRHLGIREAPRRLLAAVRGLQLVELRDAADCCGFGGTFSVKRPETSAALAAAKCRAVRESGAEYLVSGDGSCLMHLDGWMRRQGESVPCLHLAEVLDARA